MDIYKCPKMDFGFSIGGKNRENLWVFKQVIKYIIYPLSEKVEKKLLRMK
jgi:hypothetical protein